MLLMNPFEDVIPIQGYGENNFKLIISIMRVAYLFLPILYVSGMVLMIFHFQNLI